MTTFLRRVSWALPGAGLAALFQSFFWQPVAGPLGLAVAAFAALSAWRPFTALLLLAGLGPMAGVLMVLGRGDAGSIVLVEVLTLGFLAGWMWRQAVTVEPLRVPPLVCNVAFLIALAALTSAIVHSARAAVEMQADPGASLLSQTLHDYVLHLPGSEPVFAAVGLASGVLLLVGSAHLVAGDAERRSTLLRLMVCGAAGAAILNLVRVAEVSLLREDAASTFMNLLATLRVNVQYADRNAAGSYFAMLLLLAWGLAARNRSIFAAAAPVIAAALWISGSRFALASAALAAVGGLIAAAWRAGRIQTRVAGAVVIGLIIALGAIIWQRYPAGRNITAAKAFSIRVDLARAGIQMAGEHPWFGAGLGRYYELSDEYAGEALTAMGFERENAHNNFVQVLAELGVPGLVALLMLLGASLREAGRGPQTWESRWLVAGISAYLLSCLGGHPLLVPEAALPFWMAVGLAAGSAGPAPVNRYRMPRYVPALIGILLVGSIWPRATAAVREADLEHVDVGFSKWQREEDGTRYRWIGGRATFYVISSARALRIPVRVDDSTPLPAEVTVLLDGREANRFRLSAESDGWRELRLVMRPGTERKFTRVDLLLGEPGGPPLSAIATDDSGALMVGRPVIEP